MQPLSLVLRALRHPEAAPGHVGVWRAALRAPRVFDAVSCVMQLRDARRLQAIAADRPDDAFVAKVKDYNAGVTQRKVVSRTRRAEPLYQVLTTPGRDLRGERLLIVGARNVQELLIAWLHGYRWRSIQAIDLYSTHSKIHVMNMEDMTFEDDTFHAIVMATTLAYAKDTFRCLSEMARVLRPGGRFVFNASYYPEGRDWPGNHVSGGDIRDMLKPLGFDLLAYQASDKVNSLGGLQTAHLFSVQKRDPRVATFDRVDWL
jgi:SAM-dependent methyltransferase